MKIGVIGCTHIPNAMPTLPEKIKSVFRGMDIILHVGDVTDIATLKVLEDNYTITIAVAGESDSPELKKYVEPKRVVEFAKRRIGMIHGDYTAPPGGLADRMRTRLAGADNSQALAEYLLSCFDGDEVEAIVFGHTHVPFAGLYHGVFLFNPGAAAPIGPRRPSIGILDVQPRSISGKYRYL